MPYVSVKVVGGSHKEDLTAVTLGAKRWGGNGVAWGSRQSIPSGQNIPLAAYYSDERTSLGTIDLGNNNTTLEVTANGPLDTEGELVDE